MRVLRGGSDQEMTATSDVMDKARTFSGGWLGTARGRGEANSPVREVKHHIRVPGQALLPRQRNFRLGKWRDLSAR